MLRAMTAGLAVLLASACAPAPAAMSAGEASERLELFAAGADAMNVCTPQGRALLRGAVRAYGAELAQAGVAWPALPEAAGGDARRVDVAVLVAFGAGMVEMSDFSGPARRAIGQMALSQLPHVREMRAAGRVACNEVVELQQAASRFVLEMQRYEQMAQARSDAERLRRQTVRMERARTQMNDLAAVVEARLEAARGG
jgi:hypothetical protein